MRFVNIMIKILQHESSKSKRLKKFPIIKNSKLMRLVKSADKVRS